MINTAEVRALFHSPDPQDVMVVFRADSVAQESDESFTLELVPSSSTSLPTGESVFFRRTIDMTIIDSDGEYTCMT